MNMNKFVEERLPIYDRLTKHGAELEANTMVYTINESRNNLLLDLIDLSKKWSSHF